ncbi:MAG: hypothetical protein Q9164_002916 [Protoblastenia rupestris]
MLLSQPPTLLSLLFTILSTSHISNARPSPLDSAWEKLLETRYHYLSERSCASPCGWTGQLCCTSGQTCGTNSEGQAVCNSGGSGAQAQAAAGWEFYTTTYVETGAITRTSVYSSFFGAEPTAAAPAAISGTTCNNQLGESPCGTICCATGQYCAFAGQCVASNKHGGESSSAYLGQITTATATNTAPLRPTSNVATTVTSTGSATTTVPFQTPSASASAGAATASTTSNNGLSPGAIAGIVIGVIAGIIILLLLLAACCLSAGLSGIAGLLGLGKKKRRRETSTYIEEHHHHSSHGGAKPGRTWFGAGPARVDRPKKKSSGVGGLTAVAGGLGTLAILLGLKRKQKEKKAKSEYGSGSSYYSDYYSSQSEFDSS